MEDDDIPLLWKALKKTFDDKVSKAVKETVYGESGNRTSSSGWPPMRNENMEHIEPDWDELDRKANNIIRGYTIASAAVNILPMPFDVMAVTGVFSKMATELSGVYQVTISTKRAKQMGWAIATTTSSVMGATYGVAWMTSWAAGRFLKWIPGYGYLIGTAVQAPIVAVIAWSAGDTLKSYFRDCRQGREPSIAALTESFARTLRLKLPRLKKDGEGKESADEAPALTKSNGKTSATPPPAPSAKMTVSDAVDQIAGLHELMRSGAITEAEFEAKKKDLLAKI